MHLNRTLKIAAVIALLSGTGVLARHWWREYAFHSTASGAWGCGVGTVAVVSDGVSVDVQTGLDTLRLLGREVDADDLVDRFNRRIAKVPPGPEAWRDHRMNRNEYELTLSANLLIKINDPRALDLFIRMLDDPLFVSRADDWLTELGDSRAGPALLDSWKKRPSYPYVYVNAFRKLPYTPAIPRIIEVFRPHIGDYDAEHLFQTLEIISGDSLQDYRGRRLKNPAAVEALKRDLHNWWNLRQIPKSTGAEQGAAEQPATAGESK
jgi:hypothetical protein